MKGVTSWDLRSIQEQRLGTWHPGWNISSVICQGSDPICLQITSSNWGLQSTGDLSGTERGNGCQVGGTAAQGSSLKTKQDFPELWPITALSCEPLQGAPS
ncbi:hypothetical protein Y1Q_0005505 [Alligator mississippiensis]|uniref:Uncharacterized protein n=1 Tax=Alligator mississippiensis TaxID=8496 RepID=A0A151MEQ8_ALLMI|nr:hypothetical protein Y1Q_0005505 [Alligator mississippiensis]